MFSQLNILPLNMIKTLNFKKSVNQITRPKFTIGMNGLNARAAGKIKIAKL